MFCQKCGKENVDNAQFCVFCGAAIELPSQQSNTVTGDQTQSQYQYADFQKQGHTQGNTQSHYHQQGQAYKQTTYAQPDSFGNADPRDISENKVMAVLAYIIFFIPLIVGIYKTSPYAKFHTNQGTVLAITGVAYSILYSILAAILMWIPVIGWILIAVLGAGSLILFILWIYGIVNAASGKMTKLPIIGEFVILK